MPTDPASFRALVCFEPCGPYNTDGCLMLSADTRGHAPSDWVLLEMESVITSSSASLSIAGNSFPRFSALRRMPAQAFALKKYLSGALPCKICHKEDSLTALGHSPVLRIQDSPGDGVTVAHDVSGVLPFCASPPCRRSRHITGITAEGDERLEDGLEVGSSVGRECAGDVFPHGEAWVFSIGSFPHFSDDADSLEEQIGAFTFVDALPLTRHRQVLTRRTEGDDVHRLDLSAVNFGDVPQMLHEREPGCGNGDGVGFDLTGPYRRDTERMRRQRTRSAAVKQAAEFEHGVTSFLV